MEKGKIFYTTVKCPKCGKKMMVSDNRDYAFQCFDCDEDFYSIECSETEEFFSEDLVAPVYGLYMKAENDWYKAHKKSVENLCEKYSIAFSNLKDGTLDFGWLIMPDSDTIQTFTDSIIHILIHSKNAEPNI